MPKSRVRRRKKDAYTPPATTTRARPKPSPRWFPPLILFLMLFGVVWLVVAYVTEASVPIQQSLGQWNVLVGFGFIAAGFALATQWR